MVMSFDCGFTKGNNWFRYRAAAIIVENDCALVAGNEKELNNRQPVSRVCVDGLLICLLL